MASSVSTEKIFSRDSIECLHHDPDATTAVVVAYRDMRDFRFFAAIAAISALGTSGAITKLEIVAADDTSDTNLTVIKDSGTLDADALGDYIALECTAEEIRALSTGSKNLRYVAARVTCDAADAEAVLTYIRSAARFEHTGLTATTIA